MDIAASDTHCVGLPLNDYNYIISFISFLLSLQMAVILNVRGKT